MRPQYLEMRTKTEYVGLNAAQRFPTLASRVQIDITSQEILHGQLVRDVNLMFEFAGVNFYDGQGFMVPSVS